MPATPPTLLANRGPGPSGALPPAPSGAATLAACDSAPSRSFHTYARATNPGSEALATGLVPGGLLFVDLDVGDRHACAVATDGKVYCWGSGWNGQLGDGRSDTGSDEPVPIHSELTFMAVTSGANHSCALTAAGLAYCWGSTGRGALGNGQIRPPGAEPDVRPPVAVLGGHTFVMVTAGSNHTCGLTIAGLAFCWGDNEAGQLGNGAGGYWDPQTTPVPVALGHVYTHISAGDQHTCAVRDDGRVFCWGRNHLGQLGIGTSTAVQATPSPVVGAGMFVEASAGRRHTCAVTADGVAHCWGYRGFGALGTGAAIYRPVPVPTALAPQAVALGAGHRFHCALADDGSAWCWGRNGDGNGYVGQLGTGAANGPEWCVQDNNGNPLSGTRAPCSTRPVRVAAGGMEFVALTTGALHACALTAEGVAYCWGSNGGGQLGDGTVVDRASPTPVAGEVVFAALAAGGASTCGLSSSGEAYCWGSNLFGQLGDGGTTLSLTPVPVAGDRLFVAIAAGGSHMCGMDGVGAVFCWGDNSAGQLGSANSETCTITWSSYPYPQVYHVPCSRTPSRVGSDLLSAAVDAGGMHTCAIQADGTAHCWGANDAGQLGSLSVGEMCEIPYLYRTLPCSRVPLPVTGAQRFANISAGSGHTCGIAAGGQAYCWGSRDLGALGDGIDGNAWPWDPAPTPVSVTGGIQFTALASGHLHTCGLDAGGAIHCWGAAEYGETGDGEYAFDSRPMPVTGVGFARAGSGPGP
jgi:alpha-tubulin suppressor-like RCC1 family protein